MRLMSRLYLKFKGMVIDSKDAADMFQVGNLKHLIKAVEDLSESDDGETKCGLKIQIQNLLKDAAKTIKANHLVQSKNEDANVVSEFMKVFSVTRFRAQENPQTSLMTTMLIC